MSGRIEEIKLRVEHYRFFSDNVSHDYCLDVEWLLAEREALLGALNAVIDEGIVNWHDASDDTRHVHESLGLTFDQYAAWVERDWPKFVKAFSK